MEEVESKGKVGDNNSEYPKLKVMISPENENEESGSADATDNEALHGKGFGSFERIEVKQIDAFQLGLASLVNSPTSNESPTNNNPNSIDTKAPIESVKDAVSKFGGIVDWKAHKEQTVERRKGIEIELEKAQEEIPMLRKECEAAEEGKTEILKNLDITNIVIEDMKLKLEREQIEEQQAKQDSDYAKRKVEELEEGIDNEATISAKAQLEVAKAKHLAAVAELKLVRDEFEKLQLEFSTLASDRDATIKKAEDDIAYSRELERKIEDLTIQIENTNVCLESVGAEHREGQEDTAVNHELVNLEKELKEAEAELERINKETSPARNLKSKLDAAKALHQSLKDELATYHMESKSNLENDYVFSHSTNNLEKLENKTHNDVLAAIASIKKELEKVKAHIEVRKAMEEANQEKALASSMESRLLATQKEIEATKYFGKYALTSMKDEDSSNGAILSLEQYVELNQQAHEAKESETISQQRLREINHEIIQRKKTLQIELEKAEIAKEGKLKVEQRWRNLRAEHEQRRKAEDSVPEPMEKKNGEDEAALNRPRTPTTIQAPTPAQTHTQSEIEANYKEILSLESAGMAKKKKKSMFPKFWMFMGKKKASS